MQSELDSSICGPVVDELKIIIVGDWGEALLNGQGRVASAMSNWSEIYEPDWILSTGDNFYPKGIRAWNDPGVDIKWRDIYLVHEPLANLVWKLAIGNHDYGDFEGEEWNEVELTNHEPLWYMPHLWFDFVEQVGDHSVHFVVIDTEAYRNELNNHTVMVDWLDETLATSTADWKLVVGHRHVFSVGDHGPVTDSLYEGLVPIMEKYSVDAYICGHDHNLQHIHNMSGEGMDYVLSGAGGAGLYRYRPDYDDHLRQVYGMGAAFFDMVYGYVTLTTRKTELIFDYYSERNEFLYSFTRYRSASSLHAIGSRHNDDI